MSGGSNWQYYCKTGDTTSQKALTQEFEDTPDTILEHDSPCPPLISLVNHSFASPGPWSGIFPLVWHSNQAWMVAILVCSLPRDGHWLERWEGILKRKLSPRWRGRASLPIGEKLWLIWCNFRHHYWCWIWVQMIFLPRIIATTQVRVWMNAQWWGRTRQWKEQCREKVLRWIMSEPWLILVLGRIEVGMGVFAHDLGMK